MRARGRSLRAVWFPTRAIARPLSPLQGEGRPEQDAQPSLPELPEQRVGPEPRPRQLAAELLEPADEVE